MRDSTFKKVRWVGAYVTIGVLIFLGTMGLLIEFRNGSPSSTNFSGYVLGVLFIVSGVLTLFAVRLHYGGGLWSFFGLLFVGAAIFRVALACQVYMQGRHFTSPIIMYSITAGLWGVGCYCLAWGHMRNHRKKTPPKKTPAAIPAAGV